VTSMEKLAHSIQMEAFFDELHLLEKQAMINSVAELSKEGVNILSRALKGAKRLHSRGLGKGLEEISRTYQTGARKGVSMMGGKAKIGPGAGAGLANVLRTPTGSALAVGGTAAGAGLLGAGYLAGRKGSNQNVYVR
jgi:hypothetical protein